MENVVFTQLSITELRRVIRQEVEKTFEYHLSDIITKKEENIKDCYKISDFVKYFKSLGITNYKWKLERTLLYILVYEGDICINEITKEFFCRYPYVDGRSYHAFDNFREDFLSKLVPGP